MVVHESFLTTVPDPTELAHDAVARMNIAGERHKWGDLEIIDACREAMELMPVGKSGIVLGSGSNTDLWRSRGWGTLDIDLKSGADLLCDANEMYRHISPGSLDYVYAERVRMHPSGATGVGHARILQQANVVLKPGGMLIISTAYGENTSPNNLPNRHTFVWDAKQHGFHMAVVLDPIHRQGANEYQQAVTYYGQKIRSGYQTQSGEVISSIH